MTCENCGRELGRRKHLQYAGYCVLAPMDQSRPPFFNCHGGPLDGDQMERQGKEYAVGDDNGHYWFVTHIGGSEEPIHFSWWEWRPGKPVSSSPVRMVDDWSTQSSTLGAKADE